MTDVVYVYIDDDNIIQEIHTTPQGTLMQYTLIMISKSDAEDLLNLKARWEQNINTRKSKFMLVDKAGEYIVEKTTYIYYHYKTLAIQSISPRQQTELDDKEELRYGLIIVDDLIKEFISGTKNMLNYKVIAGAKMLTLEEIPKYKNDIDFLSEIPLLDDFALDDSCDNLFVNAIYNGESLTLKCSNERIYNKRYQIFLIDKSDKTKLYDTIDFTFLNDDDIIIPLTIPDNCMLVTSLKKAMVLTKE